MTECAVCPHTRSAGSVLGVHVVQHVVIGIIHVEIPKILDEVFARRRIIFFLIERLEVRVARPRWPKVTPSTVMTHTTPTARRERRESKLTSKQRIWSCSKPRLPGCSLSRAVGQSCFFSGYWLYDENLRLP